MALQVIGAGFGRTGTHSLKLALEALGLGPCHHLYEVRDNPALLPPWQEAAAGRLPDWDRLFAGFGAAVDWPASCYWRVLARHYPQAKVILTVRDPDDWFESLRQTVIRSITLGRLQDPNPHTRAVAEMIYQTVYVGLFQGRMEERAYMLDAFSRWRREVEADLSPDRLLIYDVREGWGPLCAFLGREAPKEAFPRTNSIEEFLSRKPFLSDGRASD
ncbi:MAG: sulfotransferase family protein [Limimaricola sp.]|uniref:sulfotransferase family protein n=1 Tax=Limimaricola sp. TaxID=2211665 RepID=UPI001DDC2BB0|nr:sulfotransferase family protein [Limimaricola sp.]MBI1416604.1 sulfotransferase family protein [Limimaricola sp.]